jgi:hypothetical protein
MLQRHFCVGSLSGGLVPPTGGSGSGSNFRPGFTGAGLVTPPDFSLGLLRYISVIVQ